MEKIPTHRILEFQPDTLDYMRKKYGFDKPGQMDAAIDLLDDWIKKQPHFTQKDFAREYLERIIILDKGSVERAKSQLDKLFTMRTLYPHFFDGADPRGKDYDLLHELFVGGLLPKLTKNHCRIYAGKMIKDGFQPNIFTAAFKFGALLLEHIRLHDYCSGFIGVLDFRNMNIFDFVSKLNILEVHQFATIIMEGYHMRLKGIYIMTDSKVIEILVRVLKQVFNKKIGERIFVHTSEDSLHEIIPKELLPKEFGGELKSIKEFNKNWVEELGRKENISFFREIAQAQVNENYRKGRPDMENDLLGISGSFRSLNVD